MKLRRVLTLCGYCAGLAIALHVARGIRASSAVEREIADLGARGLLLPEMGGQTSESATLEAARWELLALLAWNQALDTERLGTKDFRYFGATPMLEEAHAAELRDGVAQRAHFFDGLEALPDEVWVLQSALPDRRPQQSNTPRYMQTWTAANALCARAWVESRELGGCGLAGASLARALALARVLDNGRSVALSVRAAVERDVLIALDRIRELGVADERALLDPVALELERAAAEERFEIAIATDARFLVDAFHDCPRPGLEPRRWLRLPAQLETFAAFLDEYGALAQEDARRRMLERGAALEFEFPDSDATVLRVGWDTIAELDLEREQRIAAALRDS